MIGEQVFEGVPLLVSGENIGDRYFGHSTLQVQLFSFDQYRIMGASLSQTDILYPDVPLLPWSEIQKAYEELYLSKGTLLDVYSVELGYQLVILREGPSTAAGYNGDLRQYPEGTFDEIYHVRPVWVLRGWEPSRSAPIDPDPLEAINGVTPDVPDTMVNMLGVNGSSGIVLDAQTGELVYDYFDMPTSNSVLPTILTWDDVEA